MNRGERMRSLRGTMDERDRAASWNGLGMLNPPLPPGCRTIADVYHTDEMPMVRLVHLDNDYDPDKYEAHTGRIGTRIIPLAEFAEHHPLAAMKRVYQARKHGLRAAIGVHYLMESDELDAYDTSVYVDAF